MSGKFTPEQRELYEVVLKAELAAIRAARPGKYLWQVDEAARQVIDAAGYGDYFPHGTSHHLGLHVHDADPDAPLAPGMVITIEPFLTTGATSIYEDDDGWTLRTPDGSIGAQFEHTMIVTRGEPIVVTL